MKKIIFAVAAAVMATSLYAFDEVLELKTVGSVTEYTKTDYTITEKFGDYYRSPRAKYVHVFDSTGKQVESDEFTSKDTLVDKLLYNYDTAGKLASTVCTDNDGKIQWKSIYTYDENGNKIDESQYNANDELVNRSIFKYVDGKIRALESTADGHYVVTEYKWSGFGMAFDHFLIKGVNRQTAIKTYSQ